MSLSARPQRPLRQHLSHAAASRGRRDYLDQRLPTLPHPDLLVLDDFGLSRLTPAPEDL
jgi:hypothetical protein